MNSFRCRETGILGGRSLCVAREALYVHSSAISESERVTARLHEPSRIERRSTLPNRDHFMKCVQQPLARLAVRNFMDSTEYTEGLQIGLWMFEMISLLHRLISPERYLLPVILC